MHVVCNTLPEHAQSPILIAFLSRHKKWRMYWVCTSLHQLHQTLFYSILVLHSNSTSLCCVISVTFVCAHVRDREKLASWTVMSNQLSGKMHFLESTRFYKYLCNSILVSRFSSSPVQPTFTQISSLVHGVLSFQISTKLWILLPTPPE